MPMLAAPGLPASHRGYLELSLPPISHARPLSVPQHSSINGFFSGPLQRNTPSNSSNTASTSPPSRFYSGPIRIDNGASSTATTPPVSNPVHRRPHSIANEHLLRSGPLGKCDDPFCTTCPLYFDKEEPGLQPLYNHSSLNQKINASFSGKLKKLFRDANVWGLAHIPGVMNPHTKRVQQWNKFFLISCLLAVFVDPLFFFILSVNRESHCIYFNITFAKVITVLRSATDLVYFFHMLLQFRLAYIGPSTGIGSGALIDNPKEIVQRYLSGWFCLDVIVVLPLPQIMVWLIIPKVIGMAHAANFTKNLLRIIVLVQYFPRMIRFVPLLAGNSPMGFIFETAWANFFINLFLFLLVAHVVGSCWYLFGLQRVNQCLQDACSNATTEQCNLQFLDCGEGGNVTKKMMQINASLWEIWTSNSNASECFYLDSSVFTYGIYSSAVNVTVEKDFVNKYVYSLFWGFQYTGWKPNP